MNDTALEAWPASEGFPAAGSLHAMLGARIANATTPLMHAARTGNVGYLAELLAHGARAVNADGNGALWFACFATARPASAR